MCVALLQSSERKAVDSKEIDGDPVEESDIDGIPIDTIDGTPFESTINISTTKFKPSKWETVDPDLVESQGRKTVVFKVFFNVINLI